MINNLWYADTGVKLELNFLFAAEKKKTIVDTMKVSIEL